LPLWPSGKATLIWTPWVPQLAATASMPTLGSPSSPRSSDTQKLTESRICGSAGLSANVSSRRGSIPPVKSIAMEVVSSLLWCVTGSDPAPRVRHVVGEQWPDPTGIQPESARVRCRLGFAVLRVVRPPPAHTGFELDGDGVAEPGVERTHLADRVLGHRAEVD